MRRDEKLEIRVEHEDKARLERATRRLGLRTSTWARTVLLRELVDLEAEAAESEPAAPSDADIAAALSARGALRGSPDGRHLSSTLKRLRKAWRWQR